MSKLSLPFGEPETLRLIGIIVAALAAGLAVGYYLSRPDAAHSSKPDAPIEWNKVQAVPARAPDPEDKEWQERSDALDAASNAASFRTAAQNEEQ